MEKNSSLLKLQSLWLFTGRVSNLCPSHWLHSPIVWCLISFSNCMMPAVNWIKLICWWGWASDPKYFYLLGNSNQSQQVIQSYVSWGTIRLWSGYCRVCDHLLWVWIKPWWCSLIYLQISVYIWFCGSFCLFNLSQLKSILIQFRYVYVENHELLCLQIKTQHLLKFVPVKVVGCLMLFGDCSISSKILSPQDMEENVRLVRCLKVPLAKTKSTSLSLSLCLRAKME